MTVLGLLGACGAGDDGAEPGSSESLSDASCHWTDPSEATVTYVADGRLFEVGPDGDARCLAVLDAGALLWDQAGTRVLAGSTAVVDASGELSLGFTATAWAGPSGDLLSFSGSESGYSLIEPGSNGPPVVELSPLDEHGPVAFHPNGEHIVYGGSKAGQDGVWVSAKDGSELVVLAAGNDVAATGSAFNSDASRLWFTARHGTDSHLHVVDLVPVDMGDSGLMIGVVADDIDPATSAPIDILPVLHDPDAVEALVASPFDPTIAAVSVGACGTERTATLVSLPEVTGEAQIILLGDGTPSRPVGFFSGGELGTSVIVAESADGCAGPWDLVRVDVLDDAVVARTTLATGVDVAAPRVAWPAPNYTLVDVHISGFA